MDETIDQYRERLASMSYQDVLQSLRDLRAYSERAQARFFLRLWCVEQRLMPVLRDNGCQSFEAFLKTHGLCDPMRYREFVQGVERIGETEAEAIGFEATRMAGKVSEQAVAPYVENARQWSAEHGGVHPSRETALRHARDLDPQPVTPRPLRHVAELEALRTENKRLRARIRQLESDLRSLRGKRHKAPA